MTEDKHYCVSDVGHCIARRQPVMLLPMTKTDVVPSSADLARVRFSSGNEGLPCLEISTPYSSGEIYLQGATITHFQKHGEEPLLFVSEASKWQAKEPIRGGVPVIFPWFGPKEGHPAHGFARTSLWQVREIITLPDESICIRLVLPVNAADDLATSFDLEYFVTFGQTLGMEMLVRNQSGSQLPCEVCLHTYFNIGDVHQVSVSGLQGAQFIDKVDGFTKKTENDPEIRITGETDRVYLSTTATTEIMDPVLKRRIQVAKDGSQSTVVWNPWIAKSRKMSDFGNEEYLRMICVESGNVADNAWLVPSGAEARMKVSISSQPL